MPSAIGDMPVTMSKRSGWCYSRRIRKILSSPPASSTACASSSTPSPRSLASCSTGVGRVGWKPKIKFKELVAEMVREDLKAAERDELVKRHGYSAYDYPE